MKLNADERAIADGNQGEAAAMAMRIVAEMGEIMGAQNLAPITSLSHAGNVANPLRNHPLISLRISLIEQGLCARLEGVIDHAGVFPPKADRLEHFGARAVESVFAVP